jgi:KDO2-lipid IV(A) lauroyltransferase
MSEGLKDRVEYALAYTLLKFFGLLPRSLAAATAQAFVACGSHLARRQRRAALRNLEMAMPQLSPAERDRILRGVFRNLGRLIVEFSHFPELNKINIADHVVYEGLENYEEGLRRGRGVIYLTGHFGAWELSSFAQSIYGYPLKFVVRPINNTGVDRLIREYRTRGGNVAIQRRSAGREILQALRRNEAVGILFDQNTTSDEGIFADFFGIPAATTTAIATFALRTGAAVVPGLLIWDEALGKHRLHFDPPLTLIESGDRNSDIVENTKLFNRVLESYVRKYPDQWLWIHRRWKTRPEGDPPLY